MNIGNFTATAPSLLSWFVISCAVVITGLLYTLQKTDVAAQEISANSHTSEVAHYLSE